MSYPPYTPTPGGHPPPTSTTYPYGAYHPPPSAYGHPTTPGAYPYQTASPYQTGVTGYGWTYPYSYVHHPQAPVHVPRPPVQPATTITVNPPTAAPAPTPAPQRTSTFTSYTPAYMRESVAVAGSGGTAGRGSRKQSNLRGIFTKDLKSLMYGFGDDRNPANDTVGVMEEILIEYITDVCQAAGAPSKKARLSVEDIRRALSRPADAKKLARMEELLFMQEDIKRARAQFEETDVHNSKEF